MAMRLNQKLTGAVCALVLIGAAIGGLALTRSHRESATTSAASVAVVKMSAVFDPDGTDVLAAIGPSPTPACIEVQENWRGLAMELTCRADKRAGYVRIAYRANGSPETVELYENGSCRNPFARVSCATSSPAQYVVAKLDHAASALVEYDTAGQPIRFLPFSE